MRKTFDFSWSVVSSSLQPHGLQPAGLLCPWDSPGKNIGVGCHCLRQGIFPTQELNLGLPHCRQILYYLRQMRKGWEKEKNKRWHILWAPHMKGETPEHILCHLPRALSADIFLAVKSTDLNSASPFWRRGSWWMGWTNSSSEREVQRIHQPTNEGMAPDWWKVGRSPDKTTSLGAPTPAKPLSVTAQSFLLLNLFCIEGVAQLVKNPSAMNETLIWFLGWEDPLEKG